MKRELIISFLYEKNYVGFRKEVGQLSLSSIDKKRLYDLLRLKGGAEVVEKARELVESKEGKASLDQLEKLIAVFI